MPCVFDPNSPDLGAKDRFFLTAEAGKGFMIWGLSEVGLEDKGADSGGQLFEGPVQGQRATPSDASAGICGPAAVACRRQVQRY